MISDVISFLLSPPDWIIISTILISAGLIWWDLRRNIGKHSPERVQEEYGRRVAQRDKPMTDAQRLAEKVHNAVAATQCPGLALFHCHPDICSCRKSGDAAILLVLDAIAEPSEAMQIAGHNVRNDPVTGLPTLCGTDEIWSAMVAELRKELGDEQ